MRVIFAVHEACSAIAIKNLLPNVSVLKSSWRCLFSTDSDHENRTKPLLDLSVVSMRNKVVSLCIIAVHEFTQGPIPAVDNPTRYLFNSVL